MHVKNENERREVENIRKFMHIFSHDIRNPLLNIQALVQEADFLIKKAKQTLSIDQNPVLNNVLNEELPETLEMLQSSASRMDDMVLGANEIYHCMFDELEYEPVDMHQMFLRCFALLKLAEDGMELQCTAMPMVYADPLAVQRIVQEILSNAVKAIAACRDKCSHLIQVNADEQGDFIRFKVTDFGCGLGEYEALSAFEPFFSGENFGKGSGIGLNRAKALVEHHGGTIVMKSILEKGCHIYFTLPKI